jgi:D-amino-acid dehydrogenase
MSDSRLVVIGGGIIGLAAAWYARRDGWRVTVVERGPPGHDACSLGNAGLVTPSHFVPLAAPGIAGMALRSVFTPRSPVRVEPRFDLELLRFGWQFLRAANPARVRRAGPLLRDFCQLSRSLYRDLDREFGGRIGLRNDGVLMLVRDERHFAEERALADQARALGMEAQVLGPDEIRALDPAVRYQVAGGVLFRGDSSLDPVALNAELTRELQRQGVEFLWDTEARGWRTGDGRVQALQTTRGELQGEQYVLATGSWTPTLRAGLGLRLPVQAGKGYSLTLPDPPALPSLPSILVEARIAVAPMGGRLRFAGTMQFAGRDLRVEAHRVQAMLAAIPDYMPQFGSADFAGIEPWTGLRPVTPDGLPLLGRAPRLGNLIVATGHAMIGVTLAPATGLLVADLLAGRKPALDLALLQPARFG